MGGGERRREGVVTDGTVRWTVPCHAMTRREGNVLESIFVVVAALVCTVGRGFLGCPGLQYNTILFVCLGSKRRRGGEGGGEGRGKKSRKSTTTLTVREVALDMRIIEIFWIFYIVPSEHKNVELGRR